MPQHLVKEKDETSKQSPGKLKEPVLGSYCSN